MDDAQDSTITIFLIGEDHFQPTDIQNRKKLFYVCRQNKILFATEVSRNTKKYALSVNNEVGDLICNLFLIIGMMYLSRYDKTNGEKLFAHELSDLEIVRANLMNEDYKNEVEAIYEERYNHKNVFQDVLKEINLIENHNNLAITLEFLKQLILKNKYFQTNGLEILNIKNFDDFKGQNINRLEPFKIALSRQLKDQGFAQNIDDLISYARENNLNEIVVVLGRGHLIGVKHYLLQNSKSVLVVSNENYLEFSRNLEAWRNIPKARNNTVADPNTNSSNTSINISQKASMFYQKVQPLANAERLRRCGDSFEYEDVTKRLTKQY